MKNMFKKGAAFALAFAGLLAVNTQGQLVYSEDFTGQDGKGWVGGAPATSDFTGVTWDITGDTTGLTATSDFFVVNSGILEAQDLDATLVWESGSFTMSGQTQFDFSIDLAATGDFESSGDILSVDYAIDGGSLVNIFTGVVDEAVTDDPFFIGTTELTGSLQTFATTLNTTAGTNMEIFVQFNNNAGAEIQSIDNVSVTAIPEPSSAMLILLGMAGLTFFRRRSA